MFKKKKKKKKSDSQRCFHAPACCVKTWSLSKLQQRHEIEEKPHSKYRGDSAAPEDERCTSSTPSATVCGAHFAAAQVTDSSVVLVNSRRAEAELSQRVSEWQPVPLWLIPPDQSPLPYCAPKGGDMNKARRDCRPTDKTFDGLIRGEEKDSLSSLDEPLNTERQRYTGRERERESWPQLANSAESGRVFLSLHRSMKERWRSAGANGLPLTNSLYISLPCHPSGRNGREGSRWIWQWRHCWPNILNYLKTTTPSLSRQMRSLFFFCCFL